MSANSNPPMDRRHAVGKMLIFTSLAGGGILAARQWVYPYFGKKNHWEIASKHLETSRSENADAIDPRLKDLHQFFREARKGVPEFADEMLSWGAKWKLITDKVSFWRDADQRDEHRQFVETAFAKHVFSPDALAKTIHQVVEDFVQRDGEAINNRLLTRIREDIPISEVPGVPDPSRFDQSVKLSFDKHFQTITAAEYGDLAVGAGQFATSSVAGAVAGQVLLRVATSIATKMGLSAGLIGAGAAGAAFSFGITLVAAIVLDLLIGWAVNYFADPKGKLTESIRSELSSLEGRVIYGDPRWVMKAKVARQTGAEIILATPAENGNIGIKQELENLARLQQESRTRALSEFLQPKT